MAVALTIGAASSGKAFVLGMGGVSSQGGFEVNVGDQTDALYARSHDGREQLIAQSDVGYNGLPPFRDLGMPSIADDGSVVFGAMISENGRPRWILLRVNAAATKWTISRKSVPKPGGAFPGPVLDVDPTPAQDSGGGITFVGGDSSGGEGIFRISDGELSRLAGSGDRTVDGRRLTHIAFGSVKAWAPGECALIGWLENDVQAVLVISRQEGLRVIAAEGEPAPGGGFFKRGFGLPTGVSPRHRVQDRVVAFTARTNTGAALFLYGTKLRRVSLSKTACGSARVNFLPTARPGVNSNGKIALIMQCEGLPVIVGLDAFGPPEVLLRASPPTENKTLISDFANPWVLDSGAILFGGLDRNSREAIYQLTTGGVPEELSRTHNAARHASDGMDAPGHTVCAVTMTANRYGDFAYLGSR
jgi:hypothetical protein